MFSVDFHAVPTEMVHTKVPQSRGIWNAIRDFITFFLFENFT